MHSGGKFNFEMLQGKTAKKTSRFTEQFILAKLILFLFKEKKTQRLDIFTEYLI